MAAGDFALSENSGARPAERNEVKTTVSLDLGCGTPALPPSHSVNTSRPRLRTRSSISPRTRDSGRLAICVWEQEESSGWAVEEPGDGKRS